MKLTDETYAKLVHAVGTMIHTGCCGCSYSGFHSGVLAAVELLGFDVDEEAFYRAASDLANRLYAEEHPDE